MGSGNVPKSVLYTTLGGTNYLEESPRLFQAESAFNQAYNEGEVRVSIEVYDNLLQGGIVISEEKSVPGRLGAESHPLCLLFPSHNLAMIIDAAFDKIKGGRTKLRKLGYTDLRRTKYASAGEEFYKEQRTKIPVYPLTEFWNIQTNEKILRTLRSKKQNKLRAIDSRSMEIVRLLSEHPAFYSVEAYTFGVFLPRPAPDLLTSPSTKYDIFPDDLDNLDLRPADRVVEIPKSELESGLESLCKGLKINRAIGITSRVKTKSGVMHIPMIDLTESDEDLVINRIDSALKSMNPPHLGIFPDRTSEGRVRNSPGFIVISGRSFHFYSHCLLGEESWRRYMDTLAHLPEDVGIDTFWAKIQLAQGYSLLRITPSSNRMTQPCFWREY